MPDDTSPLMRYFEELKRRKVFRVGIGYLVGTHATDLDNLRDHPRFRALLPAD